MISDENLAQAYKTVALNRIAELTQEFILFPWWMKPFKLWTFCVQVKVSLDAIDLAKKYLEKIEVCK